MKIPSILLLLLSSAIIYAQGQEKQIEFSKVYSKAIIHLNDYTFKKVKNLTLDKEGIVSFQESSAMTAKVPYTEFRLLKIKTGAHTLRYSLYGAGIMVLASGVTALTYQQNPYLAPPSGALYLGLIGGGAILGAFVGALVPKWEVFRFPDISIGEFPNFKIVPNLNLNYKACLIGVTIIL